MLDLSVVDHLLSTTRSVRKRLDLERPVEPVADYTGDDFRPAKRVPARDCTDWNGWGQRRDGGEA